MEARLACGIYTVLSALCAVRNWKIDFVLQAHISQARNWMAAIGHAINEVVSLHRCRCGRNYEQWKDQPTPPCPTCEKTHPSETRLKKRVKESDEITDNEQSMRRGQTKERQNKSKTRPPTPSLTLRLTLDSKHPGSSSPLPLESRPPD